MRKVRLCTNLLQLYPTAHATDVTSRGKANNLQWSLISQGI